MPPASPDHGRCPRHKCPLVATEMKLKADTPLISPGTPKSSVIKIDRWVHARFPYAGYNHVVRSGESKLTLHCPRCRLVRRCIQCLTTPYVFFT